MYNQPGIYAVTLTVSNSLGSDSHTVTDIVTVNTAPTADFTYTANGNEVAFINTTSALQQPVGILETAQPVHGSLSHTYAATGIYAVTLTATNACGSNSVTNSVTASGSSNRHSIPSTMPLPAPTTAVPGLMLTTTYRTPLMPPRPVSRFGWQGACTNLHNTLQATLLTATKPFISVKILRFTVDLLERRPCFHNAISRMTNGIERDLETTILIRRKRHYRTNEPDQRQ